MDTKNAKSSLKVRAMMAVCGDLLHYGHGNAAKQALKLCDELYVGIHSDELCKFNKRETVITEKERYQLFAAIRWVNRVIEDVPWNVTCDMLDKHNCDICVHGDDLSFNADGVDSHEEVRSKNRFREFPRTDNISTTDINQRVRNIKKGLPNVINDTVSTNYHLIDLYMELLEAKKSSIYVKSTNTHYTCYSIVQDEAHNAYFNNLHSSQCQLTAPTDANLIHCENAKTNGSYEPLQTPKLSVVYTSGAFDLFNIEHLELLKKASLLGSYLIVNVLSDEEVTSLEDYSQQILSLQERVLFLLQIKYVSMVIVGAPLKIDTELAGLLKADIIYPGEYKLNGAIEEKEFNQDPVIRAKRQSIIEKILSLQ